MQARLFLNMRLSLIATILAIPNYRLKPTDKSVFRFWETPAGNPKAMRAWFYPGDNFGHEFAYPKMKSVEIARTANTEVPTVVVEKDAVDVEVLRTEPIVIVTEKGEEKPLVLMARNDPSAQSSSDSASQSSDSGSMSAKTLPHTASSMPLVGLAGMVLLAAFGLVTFFSGRRRVWATKAACNRTTNGLQLRSRIPFLNSRLGSTSRWELSAER